MTILRTLKNLKFACYHGTELQMKDALIQCGKYDVVIYGHTHKCEYEKTGNTLALNPGTAHGFGNSATVMIFDTHTKEAEIVTLSDK
ncbi:MAG: metallophosphoesterase family protein [Nitrospirae bacterium]|nr:metallophosphoesterase family protein [Nitrospirota bacterium]